MAGNSTITLQSIVDDAASMGDLAPSLATGGFSDSPALSIANDVIAAMLLGGPSGQPLNWKWNRYNVTPFCTISYQQDYFVPGVINLGWLENAWAVNINQTSNPKHKRQLEVKRDLDVTYSQTGFPGKICWSPNDQLQCGKWGDSQLASMSGLVNPGPGAVYVNPTGSIQAPSNPTTCIKDANGNYWVLTTFGTCGMTEPTWPSSPVYPTGVNPSIAATLVVDGTCVWTAVNPKGQGFRLGNIPPQTGVVWLIQPIGQMRPPLFKTLGQTIEPIPDDYHNYFKQGFFAQCYRRSPDSKVRAKFVDEWKIWLDSLDKSIRQGQREQDDFGFYPSSGLMDNGWAFNPVTPSMPYGGGW